MKKEKIGLKRMVYLAMFMALTIVLSYLNQFIPSFPQGGTVSFDIVAIFLCSYLMGGQYGVITGVGASLLQFVLGMASYWGPWSMLLDYILPISVCGLAGYFPNIKMMKIDIYIGIFISMLLKYLSHFASGAFLFAEYAPEGMNPIIYSLGYNFFYNFATFVLCMIIVPILHKRLKNVIK